LEIENRLLRKQLKEKDAAKEAVGDQGSQASDDGGHDVIATRKSNQCPSHQGEDELIDHFKNGPLDNVLGTLTANLAQSIPTPWTPDFLQPYLNNFSRFLTPEVP
jgi:hypothetical protein